MLNDIKTVNDLTCKNDTKEVNVLDVICILHDIKDNLSSITSDTLKTEDGIDMILKQAENFRKVESFISKNQNAFSNLNPNAAFDLDFILNVIDYNLNCALAQIA